MHNVSLPSPVLKINGRNISLNHRDLAYKVTLVLHSLLSVMVAINCPSYTATTHSLFVLQMQQIGYGAITEPTLCSVSVILRDSHTHIT